MKYQIIASLLNSLALCQIFFSLHGSIWKYRQAHNRNWFLIHLKFMWVHKFDCRLIISGYLTNFRSEITNSGRNLKENSMNCKISVSDIPKDMGTKSTVEKMRFRLPEADDERCFLSSILSLLIHIFQFIRSETPIGIWKEQNENLIFFIIVVSNQIRYILENLIFLQL